MSRNVTAFQDMEKYWQPRWLIQIRVYKVYRFEAIINSTINHKAGKDAYLIWGYILLRHLTGSRTMYARSADTILLSWFLCQFLHTKELLTSAVRTISLVKHSVFVLQHKPLHWHNTDNTGPILEWWLQVLIRGRLYLVIQVLKS